MENDKTEIVSITLPKNIKDEVQKMSKELYGRVNVSGYITYILNREIKNRKKETAKNTSI